ncbi:MAG: DUF1887 domain-containing protein [Microcoleus sp. PH2017_10_PVI_O_A]|uniref:DUF1887 domain-containing protein n=1 Tax=unclassified Microcoleus TaxID=2642155 RepID=UPI001D43064E|nr:MULTISPECIES: DUF1887 domain-containing protein [unclassified Microcoleus]TAE77482.1 MAG: DUF1887 domain-containing protein [Oscillatoriales cyanobacterium]MCC3406032.1 DUF1887 domain-containing protein [Microcoleus sp. PH2017_10_PVI_O_A]MCC3460221.1 DUF1887 domain-containing protein [Microcoleus sp. PH2017_11_PCY_U_A]MCC3478643.1 DUF1887 domain-containing protein [Microcoleus sp. PH2017_12_PCY_D_A]MCC3529998.1 DUF1887 domain-containing protein [Microcoleus sp. PH2017_21_RUC_O_A]
MSTSEIDYKVNHLFLLVGENPLPNYVAAMKLLKTGGTAYLVYTNQTNPPKEQLKNALKNQGFKSQPVALDKENTASNKSNAHQIYTKIKENAQKIPTNELIGLHYTGGTNPMAIHAYRAIADLQRTDTVYSYLDAKTLEIFIDHPNSDSTHRAVQLEVPLEVLFKLHKYEWQEGKKPLSEPVSPDAAAEFVRLYQNEEIAKTWRTWSNTHRYNNFGELKKAKDLETDQWKSEDELSDLSLSLTGVHSEIIEVLRQKLDASASQLSLRMTKTSKGFDNCQQVCAWLGGIWLEHYVLQQVKDLTPDLQLGESKMSFFMKKSQTREGGVFEFDVAFMRSYQLFAISCTTSKDPKECKLKLFEAYTRAKQLGGDEARVALVCCCDNDPKKPQSLDRYLKSQLEGSVSNPKIAVFIRKDLPNLKDKIADWVETNKGKA